MALFCPGALAPAVRPAAAGSGYHSTGRPTGLCPALLLFAESDYRARRSRPPKPSVAVLSVPLAAAPLEEIPKKPEKVGDPYRTSRRGLATAKKDNAADFTEKMSSRARAKCPS